MQSTIERLKEQATTNIADGQPLDTYGVIQNALNGGLKIEIYGLMLTNGEALQISEALRQATFPPIVRAVLGFLETLGAELEGPHGLYEWVFVGKGGYLTKSEYKPVFNPDQSDWNPGSGQDGFWGNYSWINNLRFRGCENLENLLFQRTADGWKWAFAENHKQEK